MNMEEIMTKISGRMLLAAGLAALLAAPVAHAYSKAQYAAWYNDINNHPDDYIFNYYFNGGQIVEVKRRSGTGPNGWKADDLRNVGLDTQLNLMLDTCKKYLIPVAREKGGVTLTNCPRWK